MKQKYEGSLDDNKKDKKASKLFGMSLKTYERSKIDKDVDKLGQKKLDVKNKGKKK